jgi:hypothetical protein
VITGLTGEKKAGKADAGKANPNSSKMAVA